MAGLGAPGSNNNGQLGLGDRLTRLWAEQLASMASEPAVAAAVGVGFAVILDTSGRVWTTGGNSQGQLGMGDTTQRVVPEQLSSPTGVAEVAAGDSHAVLLDRDGRVRCIALCTIVCQRAVHVHSMSFVCRCG